jgi:Fe-S-cluster-containing dehydrogenase component
MSIDRRGFIKLASLTALAGMLGKRPLEALAQEDLLKYVPRPETDQPLLAKRWAMAIDLRKCHEQKGCTKCIDACNATHNVPHFDNPKDEIKWIWKEHFENAFEEQEHPYIREDIKENPVLVLCNHCDSPPCVKVCPTQATFKRDDGIVTMDMHRCIGCRYCVAACPYGSRSFNWRDPRPFIDSINPDYPTRMRGVVEKCTFCEERLARGLMPACVEACEEKALIFGDLEDPESEIRKVLQEGFSIRRKPVLGTSPEIYYMV